MIKQRTLRVTAARDGFPVTVAEDCDLVGLICNGNALISRDPAAKLADFMTPLANSETDSAVIIFVSFNIGMDVLMIFPVQLKKGQIVFVSTDTAGFIQLWFNVPDS